MNKEQALEEIMGAMDRRYALKYPDEVQAILDAMDKREKGRTWGNIKLDIDAILNGFEESVKKE